MHGARSPGGTGRQDYVQCGQTKANRCAFKRRLGFLPRFRRRTDLDLRHFIRKHWLSWVMDHTHSDHIEGDALRPRVLVVDGLELTPFRACAGEAFSPVNTSRPSMGPPIASSEACVVRLASRTIRFATSSCRRSRQRGLDRRHSRARGRTLALRRSDVSRMTF